MTKILVECPDRIASVQVGVLAPLQYLQKKGQCQIQYRNTREITGNDIAWSDVLVCVRGCEYPTLCVAQAAKRAGRFLIYFLDDDLLHIPEGNASTKYYEDYQIKANLTKILSLCQVLWAVNPRVIEGYRRWCQRTVLARVPAMPIRKPPQASSPLQILFAGSVDHSAMVQNKLSPAVRQLLEEFPGELTFTFIGADPALPRQKGVSHYAYIDSYQRYQEIMSAGNYVLGLAPAYDTPFYACKYYNKFVEYTSYGIAGVYEEVPPFTDVVRDKENGFLCSGDAKTWYQKIREVISNRKELEEVATRAQQQLGEDFSPESVSSGLVSQLPELTQFQAPAVTAEDVRLPSMNRVFYQERIRLIFRMYGALACFVIAIKICKKLWKLIRRKMEN